MGTEKSAKNIAGRIRSFAEPVVRELGYELWDVVFEKVGSLYELTVYIDSDDGKLLPNNAISRKEMEELISRVYGDVIPYKMAEDSETASKAPVTYRDAVKMYVEYAGGDDFAQYKGIYKSPFTDVPESDPDVGYFALAYGAGFAVPNKDGGIDPDSLVSRGMILYMLYNSLK